MEQAVHAVVQDGVSRSGMEYLAFMFVSLVLGTVGLIIWLQGRKGLVEKDSAVKVADWVNVEVSLLDRRMQEWESRISNRIGVLESNLEDRLRASEIRMEGRIELLEKTLGQRLTTLSVALTKHIADENSPGG